MHFYTEHTNFGEETGRFSDGGENSFLVTSLFCLSEDAKAFACQKGQIIVVPNAESNALVNVILKPIDNLDIRFRNVAYYVYRGIRKDSILQSDTEMLEPSGTATDLIDRIYREADFEGAYSADMVGYSNDLTDEVTIDSLFYDMDIKKMFVLEGEWFGTFNSDTSIGFEIVVNTEICPITVGYAKQGRYAVVPSGITDFERRMSREQILAFIDPVAFWGMYSEEGLYVGSQLLKRLELNTAILSCYGNNNRVYIDIRSEYGYSYNVYGTYADSLGNSIQVGTDKNNLTARMYETNGWPIMWENELENSEKLYIRLKMPQSQKPVLHFDDTEQLGYRFKHEDAILKERGNTEWTRCVPLCLRRGNSENRYCQVFSMFYADRDSVCTTRPFGAIDKTEQRLNGKINFLFDNKLLYRRSQMEEEQYEQVSESGANWDEERIIFYTKSVRRHNWSKNMLKPSEECECEGFTLNGTSNFVSFLHNSLDIAIDTIFESSQQIPIINLIGHRNFFTFRGDVSCLCLTREIFKTLMNLTGFSTFHIRKIGFEEMTTENDEYKKFKLFVKGYDSAGNYVERYPEESVIVYGTPDELILADKEFAETELLRKTSLYMRNYEERRGNDKKRNSFINQCVEIRKEVNDFINGLDEISNDETALHRIQALVEKHASNIWEYAKHYVQGVKQNDGTYIGGTYDDRPLYWARLEMEVALKKHQCFKGQVRGWKVLPGTKLAELIQLFEEKSRNYTGINFSKAPVRAKKILITGFDPFGLRNNIEQSNPSGVVALALHRTEISDENGNIGEIQAMIFPVRYEDFDNGVIENIVTPFIKSNGVDMIMSISMNGSAYYFDLERFAGKYRGGGSDNMNISNKSKSFKQISDIPKYTKEFYQTTLPMNAVVTEEVTNNFDITRQRFFYDQSYETKTYVRNHVLWDRSQPNMNVNDFNISELSGQISKKGSGGNYLSNEIFYRIARQRELYKTDTVMKTGHLHVPNLEPYIPNDVSVRPYTMNEIIEETYEAIKRCLEYL